MAIPTGTDPNALLNQAITHHQAGRLVEAERLYRIFLARQPRQPDAHHNLGVLAMQTGRVKEGLPHLKEALEINPTHQQYWLSYVRGLMCAGEFESAQTSLQTAISHGLHGENVWALQQKIASTRQSLNTADVMASHKEMEIDPIPGLLAMFNSGNYDELVIAAQTLLRNQPNQSKVLRLLGATLSKQGRDSEALALLEKATTVMPNDVDVWLHLAAILTRLGQPNKALPCYSRGVDIDPMRAKAWLDFSACAYALGRYEEACRHAERALALKSDYAEAYNNLGIALNELGRLQDAVINYRRALEIKPDHADIHNNLGNSLKNLGQLQDAAVSYRRALEFNPNSAIIHGNLGNTLLDLGQIREAIICYESALELKPDDVMAFSGVLFCLSHMEESDPIMVYNKHLAFGQRFEAPLQAEWYSHDNDRIPDRKLRVGFVSADLYRHSVTHFIEPVWRALDKSSLDLYVYSNHLREDEVTVRLKKLACNWRQVSCLSDQELAEYIRTDGIDILFDLSGHTGHHRLLTFARKPAPVQVTWIGYPGTTGLRAMDYKLTDCGDPPGMFDHLYTEKFACLPGGIMFEPEADAPHVNSLPALTRGYITFGSFNRTSKLGNRVIALWSKVLQALPTSRMLIGSVTDNGLKTSLTEHFSRWDIEPERLEFRPRVGMRDYLKFHHEVDIILDTFPYTGGTTTNHALWMGVPVLTLTGPTRVHYQSARILWRIGLPEWVVSNEDQFVSQAVFWATHVPELAMLRSGLRKRFDNSSLRCPETVARGLENAMRIMWRRWCAGLPPERFEVTL